MSLHSEKKFSFKAETKKLLEIIIKSLYQQKEVFIRELISNASDALGKIRIKQLTSEKVFDGDTKLEIKIIVDKENNTLTIRDSGIGMTQLELKNNLGTIAKSGTEEFFQAIENQDTDPLIGMFGVGFYSAFLVADEVKVVTRSFNPSSKVWEWVSEGIDSYSISEGERERRGTDIILKIKDDQKEFLEDYKLKELVKKYSNYVEYPIILGEETLNEQTALWRLSPSEVEEKQYEEFFRHLGQFGNYFLKLHVSVDVPIEFHSILYIPANRPRYTISEKEWGLKLYNRKILIEEKNKDLLPEYMRFIVGVIDAEDFDLNVSREVLQNTRIQRQITKYLEKKILDEIEKIAKDDDDKYMEFYNEFGVYIKEGISANTKHKSRLTDLLRFHTTDESGHDGSVSLADYIERMKVGQDKIYYLSGLELDTVKKSPHLEYYDKEGFEVILMGETIDSFLMMHLKDYNEKEFFLIDQDESEDTTETEKVDDDKDEEDDKKDKIKTGPHAPILNKIIEILGSKVNDVKISDRLVNRVARLVTPKGGISSDLQRAMKIMESQSGSPSITLPMMGKILQINPNHEIIKSLEEKILSNTDDELIKLVIEQIHDNARLADGELLDFTELINRTEKIIEFGL